jgi:hypothetical protein
VVVIFGWGAGEAQDLGEVAPVTCPNCHNDVFLHHIRSDKRVSLYFIPLASYGTDEYLACPICRSGMQVGPQHRAKVNEMKAATAVFRRGGVRQDYYLPTVERFWRTMGVAPSGQQVVQAASTVPPPGAPATPSLASQLKGLADLHANGVLTDEEFAAAKRRLLGS